MRLLNNMDNAKITVLLATYNGEKYVEEMIDSVLAQDYDNIELILSDDGSIDKTISILDIYAQKYPDKVKRYVSGQKFGSAQKHFMHLLKTFHDSPYVMFCDQDDFWHKDKVSKTLEKMQEIEKEGLPVLVHTDLRVVDAGLKEISPSFCKQMRLRGKETSFNRYLVQNFVTGCTMLMNRALVELAIKDYGEGTIQMHDWWIALIASAFGKIAFLNQPTIDYRQHGNNVVGAKDVGSVGFVKNSIKTKKMQKSILMALAQAKLFNELYKDYLSGKQLKTITAFISTENKCLLKRDYIYIRHKLLKRGFLRKVAQLMNL